MFCPGFKKICMYGCMYLFAVLVLMCVDVIVLSSAYAMYHCIRIGRTMILLI